MTPPRSQGAALITGASGGIGYELAVCCASGGYPLVLAARRLDELEHIALDLRRRFDVEVTALRCDLAEPDAAAQLVAHVRQAGLQIELLINNAGFGTYGPFVESDTAAQLRMLQVNCSALTHLTRLLLPEMVERRRGRVLNVASTAAFQPGPLMAVYYATKAYVVSLSSALRTELSGSGVTVTALCPGPTKTDFQERAGIRHLRLISLGLMEANAVAQAGYRGMMAGRRLVIPGWSNRLCAVAVRVMPMALTLRLLWYLQQHRRIGPA